jgi:hypothetical protein
VSGITPTVTAEVKEQVGVVEFRSVTHDLPQILRQAAMHCGTGWDILGISYERTKEATTVRFTVLADKRVTHTVNMELPK